MRLATRTGPAVAAIGMLIVLAVSGCGKGGTSTSTSTGPRRVARPCGPGQLVASHEGRDTAAASHEYTRFTLFNLSSRACSISGYPKLVALGVGGRSIGVARRGIQAPDGPRRPVIIAGRGRAAFLDSRPADVYSPGVCNPGTIARYRVVLPGSNLPQSVPYPTYGYCRGHRGQGTLSVGRIEPLPDEAAPPQGPLRLDPAEPGERLPRCAADDLLVWAGPHYFGGIAAGTAYLRLEVENLSALPCKLSGFPRMVAVDLRGRPIGPPVARSGGLPPLGRGGRIRVARIGARERALFTFTVGEVLDYGDGGCDYRYAAGFDVTLPGDSRARYVPAPTRRCLRAAGQVAVGPIE